MIHAPEVKCHISRSAFAIGITLSAIILNIQRIYKSSGDEWQIEVLKKNYRKNDTLKTTKTKNC
jgi:hypothetical protein